MRNIIYYKTSLSNIHGLNSNGVIIDISITISSSMNEIYLKNQTINISLVSTLVEIY